MDKMSLQGVLEIDKNVDVSFLEDSSRYLPKKKEKTTHQLNIESFQRAVFSKMPRQTFHDLSDNEFLKTYLKPKFIETVEEEKRLYSFEELGWIMYAIIPNHKQPVIGLTPLGEYATTWFGL